MQLGGHDAFGDRGISGHKDTRGGLTGGFENHETEGAVERLGGAAGEDDRPALGGRLEIGEVAADGGVVGIGSGLLLAQPWHQPQDIEKLV